MDAQYDGISVRETLSIIFLRKWTVFSVFLGVVSVSAFLSLYFLSPSYEASATIIVNTSNIVKPDLDEPPISDFEKLVSFHTQKDIIRSMPIVTYAVDELGLDKNRAIGNVERVRMFMSDIKRGIGRMIGVRKWVQPHDPRAASINAVLKNLKVVSNPDSKVLKITYQAKNDLEAERTLDLILAKYQDYYYGLIRNRAAGTLAFLDVQSREIKKQLADAESEMLKFKQSDTLKLEGYGNTEPNHGGERNGLTGITDSAKAQEEMKLYVLSMEEELRKLMAQYTDVRPDVALLKGKISTYVQALNAIPKKELDLLRLRRNMEINQEIYLLLQKNLEKAKFIKASNTDKTNLITVIERAKAGKDSVSPKPIIIMPVSIVFGMVFGIVCAIIRNYFDHSIRSVRDVDTYLGLRTIGSLRVINR